jgi:hypothetical protein
VTHDGACGEVKANMSLGLHADCQKRLIEKIGDLLGEVKVINGNSLDVDSFMGFFELDSVLPDSGSTRDLLDKYIGETPTFGFMFDTLANELTETLKYDTDAGSIALTDIEEYKDSQAIARRLVANLRARNRDDNFSLTDKVPVVFASDQRSFSGSPHSRKGQGN